MWLLYLLVFFGACWLGPGYLVSRWLWPQSTPLERLATSLLTGIIFVVPLAFFPGFLLRTPLTPFSILCAALSVAAGAAILIRFRPRKTPPCETPAGRERYLVLGVMLLAAYSALTTLPDHSTGVALFQPCPHQSAQFLLSDGRNGGLYAFDAEWGQVVHHVMEHDLEPGYGLFEVLGNQRPGSMATIAQPIAFLGSGGLVAASFGYDLLFLSFATLLITHHVRQWWLTLLLATLFHFGIRDVATYAVNENMLAGGLAMATLHLLLRRGHRAETVLAGIALSLCVGVRPLALAYVPAAFWLLRSPRRWGWFSLALTIGLIPWLVTQKQVFGQAFFHPALDRGQYAQQVLGFTITFHPLGFPFSDTLLRPDGEPFPNLLALPLTHLRAFGALLWVCILTGVVTRVRRLGPLILWSLPSYALLLAIVHLDREKLSYALLSMGPIAWLLGAGAAALYEKRLSLQQKLIALQLCLALIVGFPWLLKDVELPIDSRKQYTNRRYEDPRPVQDTQSDLTTPRFFPSYSERNPSRTFGLLSHGRPPQSDPNLPEAPVFIWRPPGQKFTHRITLPITDAPVVPPGMGEADRLYENWRHTAVVVPIRNASRFVEASVSHDGKVFSVDAVTSPGTLSGYISVGLSDLHIGRWDTVRTTVDGNEVAPTVHKNKAWVLP